MSRRTPRVDEQTSELVDGCLVAGEKLRDLTDEILVLAKARRDLLRRLRAAGWTWAQIGSATHLARETVRDIVERGAR